MNGQRRLEIQVGLQGERQVGLQGGLLGCVKEYLWESKVFR